MGRGTAGRRPVVEGPATRAPAPAPPSRAFGTRHLPIGSADREDRQAPPKILPVTRKRHGEGDRRPRAGGGGASRRSPSAALLYPIANDSPPASCAQAPPPGFRQDRQ